MACLVPSLLVGPKNRRKAFTSVYWAQITLLNDLPVGVARMRQKTISINQHRQSKGSCLQYVYGADICGCSVATVVTRSFCN